MSITSKSISACENSDDAIDRAERSDRHRLVAPFGTDGVHADDDTSEIPPAARPSLTPHTTEAALTLSCQRQRYRHVRITLTSLFRLCQGYPNKSSFPPPEARMTAPTRLDVLSWLAAREEIMVTPLIDPVVEAHGHDPRSPYAEAFWLPILGPSIASTQRSALLGHCFISRRSARRLRSTTSNRGKSAGSRKKGSPFGYSPMWRGIPSTAQEDGEKAIRT